MLEELKRLIHPVLPTYLAIFDLADTKRRNLYLGFSEVDRDILEFETLLKNALDSLPFKRISGGQWIACLAESQLDTLSTLLLSYAKEAPIVTGWECRGIDSQGTVRCIEEKQTVLIRRAVRCGYVWIENIHELATILNEMLDKIWKVSVNIPTDLASDLPVNSPKWQCLSEHSPAPEYCPFCQGTRFDWSDGADDAATGTCQQCGAAVNFCYGLIIRH